MIEWAQLFSASCCWFRYIDARSSSAVISVSCTSLRRWLEGTVFNIGELDVFCRSSGGATSAAWRLLPSSLIERSCIDRLPDLPMERGRRDEEDGAYRGGVTGVPYWLTTERLNYRRCREILVNEAARESIKKPRAARRIDRAEIHRHLLQQQQQQQQNIEHCSGCLYVLSHTSVSATANAMVMWIHCNEFFLRLHLRNSARR